MAKSLKKLPNKLGSDTDIVSKQIIRLIDHLWSKRIPVLSVVVVYGSMAVDDIRTTGWVNEAGVPRPVPKAPLSGDEVKAKVASALNEFSSGLLREDISRMN